EIQVGILKRLRGTPIARHDSEWQMVYTPFPPYEILQNKLIDFPTMQKLRRFARYWDLVGNSGNFVETTPLIWSSSQEPCSLPGLSIAQTPQVQEPHGKPSPFYSFMHWSEWLHARVGRTDGIALVRLMELLFNYLTENRKLNRTETAEALWRDYQRGGRYDKPSFLKDFLPKDAKQVLSASSPPTTAKRQSRHGMQLT
ncbi:MAG TPA: DUF4080 domain-containing protein, partial [Clostridia bacterium]|nr:DUF4080 domain-containing protein [Clostridia bacterium]